MIEDNKVNKKESAAMTPTLRKPKKRKVREGWVVKDKMQKTIVVRVEFSAKHNRYKKIIKKFNKFKVHDESNKAKVGNFVKIEETRPLSKEKRWRLVEILK